MNPVKKLILFPAVAFAASAAGLSFVGASSTGETAMTSQFGTRSGFSTSSPAGTTIVFNQGNSFQKKRRVKKAVVGLILATLILAIAGFFSYKIGKKYDPRTDKPSTTRAQMKKFSQKVDRVRVSAKKTLRSEKPPVTSGTPVYVTPTAPVYEAPTPPPPSKESSKDLSARAKVRKQEEKQEKKEEKKAKKALKK